VTLKRFASEKRHNKHRDFTISEGKVCLLIAEADKAFRSIKKQIASGDPDLFVYNESAGDWFFVEIKENDQVTDNQRILFPLIQKFLCPVFVARVIGKCDQRSCGRGETPLPPDVSRRKEMV
jgi:hypothetical protein